MKEITRLVNKVASEVAESHGCTFPCGIEEEDNSFVYWAKRILEVIKSEADSSIVGEG